MDDLMIKIPKTQPTVVPLKNSMVFNKIGELSPILQFVHLRTSVNVTELEFIASKICYYSDMAMTIGTYYTKDIDVKRHPRFPIGTKRTIYKSHPYS